VDEIKGGLVQCHAVDGGPQVDDVTLLGAGGVCTRRKVKQKKGFFPSPKSDVLLCSAQLSIQMFGQSFGR
jgi:hypothetical protein